MNWPNSRGTATAFPMAAYGLSAFFYSTLSATALQGNTSRFLVLLAAGTSASCLVGFFFLQIVPHSQIYSAIPDNERRQSYQNGARRSMPGDGKNSSERSSQEPGRQPVLHHQNSSLSAETPKDSNSHPEAPEVHRKDTEETSSLLSVSASSAPEDVPSTNHRVESIKTHHSHQVDIRGVALLPKVEFWQLFLILGLLSGVGLMTIK